LEFIVPSAKALRYFQAKTPKAPTTTAIDF